MRLRIVSWLSSLPLLLLLPYLLVICFQDADTALLVHKCSVEDFLPLLVSRQIAGDAQEEAVKCQAVIARSNLCRHLANGEGLAEAICAIDPEENRNLPSTMRNLLYGNPEKFYAAVQDTEGCVLQYKGEWKLIPYHELSNGYTRNGEEVFHDEAYAYLKSVNSDVDKESGEYLSSFLFSQRQLPEELLVEARDSGGYVLYLTADGKPIEGEAFREGMHLASSDFIIQKMEDGTYRFLCKGKGHGLGFSQYGGNALAAQGKTCREILSHYFPTLEITSL